MGEIKTHRTESSPEDYIAGITDPARRADCIALMELMQRATGESPSIWSSGLVGFGTFHYRSRSGQEGDWFPVGFANRKAALTIYLGMSIEEYGPLLDRLGKHTVGKGCIYVKRLSDVDLSVLEQLVAEAYRNVMETYG